MPAAYRRTTVPAHRSMEQIEKILAKHDVDAFRWTSIAWNLGLEFRHKGIGYCVKLTYDEKEKAQYLRALFFWIKATLEAVEFGLVSFERAFMPALITGPDRTLGDDVLKRLVEGGLGQGVPLLPEGRDTNP